MSITSLKNHFAGWREWRRAMNGPAVSTERDERDRSAVSPTNAQ